MGPAPPRMIWVASPRVPWMLQSWAPGGVGLLLHGLCFSMAALDDPFLCRAPLDVPILGCFAPCALDAPIHGAGWYWSPSARLLPLCSARGVRALGPAPPDDPIVSGFSTPPGGVCAGLGRPPPSGACGWRAGTHCGRRTTRPSQTAQQCAQQTPTRTPMHTSPTAVSCAVGLQGFAQAGGGSPQYAPPTPPSFPLNMFWKHALETGEILHARGGSTHSRKPHRHTFPHSQGPTGPTPPQPHSPTVPQSRSSRVLQFHSPTATEPNTDFCRVAESHCPLPLTPSGGGGGGRALIDRCVCHCKGPSAAGNLQYTVSLQGGSGQCNFVSTLPHCRGQGAV